MIRQTKGVDESSDISNIEGSTVSLEGELAFNRKPEIKHPHVHEVFRTSLVDLTIELGIVDNRIVR